MSNYDPAQQPPWGGQPPQDPYGGPPQYPPPQYPQNPQNPPGGFPPGSPAGPPQYPPPPPGGYPSQPPTTAFPAGGGFPPPQDPYAAGDAGYPPPGGGYPPPGEGFPPPPGDGFPPGGGFAPSPPARRGGATKIVIAIAAVVLIALCAGGGYTAYKLTSDNQKNKPAAGPSPTTSASPTASPTSRPSGSPSASAPGGGGTNPDALVKGDCFVNDGNQNSPRLRKVDCSSAGAFEVVVKITSTTDQNRCNTAPPVGAGQGKWDVAYKMDKNPGVAGDYVLCLKQRA